MRWIRREAVLRHTTQTAIIENALVGYFEQQKAEAFARAALKAICRALAKDDAERMKQLERQFVSEALVDMRVEENA